MSNKTRPRRRPAPAGAARREDPDTLVDRMVGSLWQAVAAGDLLRAELEAATCMALPRVGRLAPEDAQAFVSKVLVDEAVRQPSAEGAAMLRLLMSLGSPADQEGGERGSGRADQSRLLPAGVGDGGREGGAGQAWHRYDVFGDDEAIAVTFRYGEAEHGVIGHIDLTGIPVAIAVGVAIDAASLIEAMTREDDPFDRVEQIGLAEARRGLEAPLARCDEDPDPGLARCADGVPAGGAVPGAAPARRGRRGGRGLHRGRPRGGGRRLPGQPAGRAARAADEDATRFWAEVLTGYSSRIPGEPLVQIGPRKIAHPLLGHVPNTFALSAAQREAPRAGGDRLGPLVGRAPRAGEAATARLADSLPEVLGRFDAAYDYLDAVTARSYLAGLAASDADVAQLAGHVARRMFAVPVPPSGGGGAPVDLSDPAVRWARTEAEFAACTPHSGLTVEEFRAAVQRVIAELWDDDPKQTFAAARRMFASGADRHDIIHTLAERKTTARPPGRHR